jgi:hypothetical protein
MKMKNCVYQFLNHFYAPMHLNIKTLRSLILSGGDSPQ